MSNRSTWPEGCEVHQKHLEYDTSQRVASDKQILADATSRGVSSGLVVTVSATNTRIDISSGSAYTPSGEYVTLTSNQIGVALADYTLGVKNYVLLVYDEAYSQPESHETDGSTRNTKASVSPRLTVITEAAYNALSLNNPVLSTNDLNRSVVLAKVTANGVAVPLTSGSIELPTAYPAVLNATQPINITGVAINLVDSLTTPGTGTLTFNFGAVTLTWAAPGDSAGTPVVLSTSTTYLITSNNGRTLQVVVSFSALPSSNKSDVITISNIYLQSVARHTALDLQHRTLLGSGVPTANNPHGMTLSDLAPGTQGTVEEHQDVQHSNGLARFNNSNTLKLAVNVMVGTDTLNVPNFSAGDYAYVNGYKITNLASSSTMVFGIPEGNEVSTWGIYLNQDATLVKVKRCAFLGTTDLIDKLQIVNMSDDMPAGSLTITWTSGGVISANSDMPKAAPPVDSVIRLYVDRVKWIECFVKGASTPGVTQADTITFFSPPLYEENMLLGYVQWFGAAGTLGYGFGPAGSPNLTWDRRPFGTLGTAEISDEAGYSRVSDIGYEVMGDGVALLSEGHSFSTVNQRTPATAIVEDLVLGALAYPNIPIVGGHVIVGGKHFKLANHNFTVLGNNTNRMYVDYTGAYQVSQSSWDTIVGNQAGKPIVRLAELVLDAGNLEVSRSDLRVITGSKHDVEGGVVGLDRDRRAVIQTPATASSGVALLVGGLLGTNVGGISATSTGTATAIQGVSFGATGHAVTGASSGSGSGVRGTSAGSGNGGTFIGGLTNGVGVSGTGTATGTKGGAFQGGPTTGPGLESIGGGSGQGVIGKGGVTDGSMGGDFLTTATNGNGAAGLGSGTGFGLRGSGGATSGTGVIGLALGGNGIGVSGTGFGTGGGGTFTSGSGATGDGALGTAASTNGNGVKGVGTGTGAGVRGEGTGNGGSFTGGAGKIGLLSVGGSSSYGAEITGTTNAAIHALQTGGHLVSIKSDGYIDMDGGIDPITETGLPNVLTRKNILRAWALVGLDSSGVAVLLRSYNIGSITTTGNGINLGFSTNVGFAGVSGTTIVQTGAGSVLQMLATTSPFTAEHVGRWLNIAAGPNAGNWRIFSVDAPNLVSMDAPGAVNDGVARSWSITDTPYVVETSVDDISSTAAVAGVGGMLFARAYAKLNTGFSFTLRDSAGTIATLGTGFLHLLRTSLTVYGLQD